MTSENKGFFSVQMGILSTVVKVLTRNYLLSRKLFAGAGSPGADTQVRSPRVWKDGRRSPLEVMVKGLSPTAPF